MTEHTAALSTSALDSSRERFLSPVEAARSPHEVLVGINEAAEYLGLSPTHVGKMARQGELPVINFSAGKGHGTWRFYISALAEFCRGRLSSAYASTPQNGVTP
jgi:excisionase family DNA binding protein